MTTKMTPERKSAPAPRGPRSDLEIQQAVISELAWDKRVGATDVGVEVDAGVVTLTGTVSSYGKKIAAGEAAHRALGVLDVANDIVVRTPGSPGRTDTDIAQAVRSTLEWDVLVPHEDIPSTVTHGWVTLTGTVTTLQHRRDAERAVRYLTGVRGVTNQIEIGAVPSYQDLETRIREALERRANRAARRIKVSIKGGRVTLWGVVRSSEEHDAILGTVRHAPGVREVKDELVCTLLPLGAAGPTPSGWRNK